MQVKTVVCSCSAGRRRTCVGLLKAPTWLPSTSVALPCGVARNSNRFRGLAIRVSPSSTSHHVRGKQHQQHLTHTHTFWSVQSSYCVYSVLNRVWLCFPGMWWPSVHWWTLRRTHRPSSSGTSWPDRKREASTARARHIGPFSSQSSLFFPLWSPPFKLLRVLNLKWTEMGCFPLRWSHDGKFFARMTTDTLSIYETPVS